MNNINSIDDRLPLGLEGEYDDAIESAGRSFQYALQAKKEKKIRRQVRDKRKRQKNA